MLQFFSTAIYNERLSNNMKKFVFFRFYGFYGFIGFIGFIGFLWFLNRELGTELHQKFTSCIETLAVSTDAPERIVD